MEINRLIDHTLLKPEATEEQILKIIAENMLQISFKVST